MLSKTFKSFFKAYLQLVMQEQDVASPGRRINWDADRLRIERKFALVDAAAAWRHLDASLKSQTVRRVVREWIVLEQGLENSKLVEIAGERYCLLY